MSQADIMQILDENPGRLYSCNMLHKALNEKVAKRIIHRCLKKIVRREEYYAKITFKLGQPMSLYGRKTNGKEGKNRRRE